MWSTPFCPQTGLTSKTSSGCSQPCQVFTVSRMETPQHHLLCVPVLSYTGMVSACILKSSPAFPTGFWRCRISSPSLRCPGNSTSQPKPYPKLWAQTSPVKTWNKGSNECPSITSLSSVTRLPTTCGGAHILLTVPSILLYWNCPSHPSLIPPPAELWLSWFCFSMPMQCEFLLGQSIPASTIWVPVFCLWLGQELSIQPCWPSPMSAQLPAGLNGLFLCFS